MCMRDSGGRSSQAARSPSAQNSIIRVSLAWRFQTPSRSSTVMFVSSWDVRSTSSVVEASSRRSKRKGSFPRSISNTVVRIDSPVLTLSTTLAFVCCNRRSRSLTRMFPAPGVAGGSVHAWTRVIQPERQDWKPLAWHWTGKWERGADQRGFERDSAVGSKHRKLVCVHRALLGDGALRNVDAELGVCEPHRLVELRSAPHAHEARAR
eukprot:1074117-Rhodomonas_salina.1